MAYGRSNWQEPGDSRCLGSSQHPSLYSSHTDDKLEQQHSLFTRYKDPCRLGPGEEKPWAIGKQGAGLTMGFPRTLVKGTCPRQLYGDP